MVERLPAPERKLWFDGPNYTADGIVVHVASRRILLIRRQTGEWALPGGFIDANESAKAAAIREVAEETTIVVTGDDALLAFCGRVDDPRNSEASWIETSAYIFVVDTIENATAQDDAADAHWFSLDELPPLYASHGDIVQCALGKLPYLSPVTGAS